MVFCKNSGGIPSARCGGISTTMSDKSMSSEAVAATSAETPQGPSAARKIYPIVKYGDPVLEKPGAPVKKFDAGLEQLTEDMFASIYAAQGGGLAAPQIGLSLRLAVVDVTGGEKTEAKILLGYPGGAHPAGERRAGQGD